MPRDKQTIRHYGKRPVWRCDSVVSPEAATCLIRYCMALCHHERRTRPSHAVIACAVLSRIKHAEASVYRRDLDVLALYRLAAEKPPCLWGEEVLREPIIVVDCVDASHALLTIPFPYTRGTLATKPVMGTRTAAYRSPHDTPSDNGKPTWRDAIRHNATQAQSHHGVKRQVLTT